jgi:hypothetical protein
VWYLVVVFCGVVFCGVKCFELVIGDGAPCVLKIVMYIDFILK